MAHLEPARLSGRYDILFDLAWAAMGDARQPGVPLGPQDVTEAQERGTATATPDRDASLAHPLADAVTGHVMGTQGR